MKLKTLLAFLLVIISTCIYAQLSVPKLVSSQIYSAKGAGSSGIPIVTFNVPSGYKNMLLRVAFLSERYNPSGDNYINTTNTNFTTINIGGNTNAKVYDNLLENYADKFTIHAQGFYLLEKNGLSAGNKTITFPGIQAPKNSNDEMTIVVMLYENASDLNFVLRNTPPTPYVSNVISLSATAPTPILGRSAGDFLYMTHGYTTDSSILNLSSGWNVNLNETLINTGTPNISSSFPNENDGISYIVGHRNYSTGNPSVTLTRNSNIGISAIETMLFAITPLASPSISGTVYKDTDGGVNINGTVTNAGGTYVNVINSSNNLVYSSIVTTSGVFTIPIGYVEEGSIYRLELSKNTGVIGASAPIKELPSGWGTVGENSTGISPYPSDGINNGTINLTIENINIMGLRFGINGATCNAGTTTPIVQNINNTCPTTFVDLNTAHTGSIPSGASLVWFTNNTHTGTSLKGTQITQAGGGTYYAFYFDSVNNCYSPVSVTVNVTINPCFVCPPDPYAAQQTWWLPYEDQIVRIDFQSGSAVLNNPINGILGHGDWLSYEGNTTVTNPITGELLFVTNGDVAYRGSDGLKAIGSKVGGSEGSGEAAAVIPDPEGILGRDFIIFGNSAQNEPGTLRSAKYNIENNTVYDVKNLLPEASINEALEVIPHTNGTDYWILVHTTNQQVKSYLFSKTTGFNSTAFSTTNVQNLSGVDPDFGATSAFISWDPRTPEKLLIARDNKIGLANFNPSTGILGNWDVKITSSTSDIEDDRSTGYSAALSPNGKYIYYAPGGSNLINYYNLINGNTYTIGTVDFFGNGLKIGPDNKLYVIGFPDGMSGLYYYNTPDSPSIVNSNDKLPIFYTGDRNVSLQLPNNVYWGCITCQSGNVAPIITDTNITSRPTTIADLIALLTVSNQPTGTVITIHSEAIATDENKLQNSDSIISGKNYYIAFYDGLAICYSPTIAINPSPICYNDPILENGFKNETNTGITLLKRSSEWPMARNSGHIALESNSLGFVPARMTTVQLETIKSAGNAIEAMMSYDIDAKCMKIYDGTSWKCFNTPSCP